VDQDLVARPLGVALGPEHDGLEGIRGSAQLDLPHRPIRLREEPFEGGEDSFHLVVR
jgi:hypothetical protein